MDKDYPYHILENKEWGIDPKRKEKNEKVTDASASAATSVLL
jgi:hypothetical protein